MNKFLLRIYPIQDEGTTFKSINEFLAKMDSEFIEIHQNSFESLLLKQKFNYKIVRHFSALATLVNYNQYLNVNGFVGLVSLAGCGADLWNVRGGNSQIVQKVLEKSEANVFYNTDVLSVSPSDSDVAVKNVVVFKKDGKTEEMLYDYVVLAFPLTKDLDENFLQDFTYKDYMNYEMKLTKTYFIEGFVNAFPSVPRNKRVEIYCVEADANMRCGAFKIPCDFDNKKDAKIGLDNEKKFYKLFAQDTLTDEELLKVLEPGYNIIKVIDWYAYPKYDSIGQKLPKIIIDSEERARVFNLNAVEWAASCIEMSCISARNIALLISNKVQGEAKTREMNTKYASKPELIKKVFVTGAGLLLCAITSLYWFKK